MSVFNFDSVADLVAACPVTAVCGNAAGSDFTNNESYADSLKNALTGRMEGMNDAEAMIDSLITDSINTSMQAWQPNVAGALPIVPAAIAGSPFSMLQKTDMVNMAAPVRIFASVATSGGVGSDALSKRGAAILALVLKLQETRPVELFLVAEFYGNKANGGSSIPCVSIPTAPLDTTAVSYALTSSAFMRQLLFNFTDQHGFDGRWAYGGNPLNAVFQEKIKAELGCQENDIYIRGAYLSDKSITDPAEWVQERLDEITGQEY